MYALVCFKAWAKYGSWCFSWNPGEIWLNMEVSKVYTTELTALSEKR